MYLRAVGADPLISSLRADRRRAVLELARILARHADWRTMTSWRPRARACAEIGSSRDPSKPLSISAYKRARQVLEERGFLGLVAQGWTSSLRAGALDDGTGTSAVFVLTIPRPRRRRDQDSSVNGPLSSPRSGLREAPARAREAGRGKTGAGTSDPEPAGQTCAEASTGPWPSLRIPQNRAEEERAAGALRDRCRPLARLSARHVRHLVHEWFTAGWDVSSLVFAVEHSPAGRQHGYTSEIRHAPGWLASRTAAWRDRSGRPMASPSQRRAAERDRVRAEQAAARQARQEAAERAALVDVAGQAARAREMLRTRPNAK